MLAEAILAGHSPQAVAFLQLLSEKRLQTLRLRSPSRFPQETGTGAPEPRDNQRVALLLRATPHECAVRIVPSHANSQTA